uniref:Uncharacterized protein n=1 Tax=Dulem virus 141 TaxID=3145618 RepID=A0AAU8B0I5_9VIRU
MDDSSFSFLAAVFAFFVALIPLGMFLAVFFRVLNLIDAAVRYLDKKGRAIDREDTKN